MSVELSENENTYKIKEWGIEMPARLDASNFMQQDQND